ncbi:hypothetical protein, partial [Nonlabens dokdonensis]|uniref:hypothetical protein n=1 Tax=Nonlabens dokdonensis TaxID=328515 RepID=UPI0026EC6823
MKRNHYSLWFSFLSTYSRSTQDISIMTSEAAVQTTPNSSEQSQYQVIRRNGQVTSFDGSKISIAITKAFLAVEGSSAQDSDRI